MSSEIIKLIYPDVAVSRGRRSTRRESKRGGALLLEPVTIPPEFVDEVRQARVQILHRPERTLVAVLELLSPWNKTGDGFLEYKAKRRTILAQKIHLVELDLLIAGSRLPLRDPLPPGDYYAMISRAEDRPNCEVYPWTVRQRLPVIPIPLRGPDADLIVELSEVFQTTYQRGRYAKSLPYGHDRLANLPAKEKRWASALSSAGPR